jgi:Ras GTPase-activating-like protein IQGAP2/3
MLLEARMLLREMVEYQHTQINLYPRDPEFDKLMSLIAVLPDDGEERDWIADISELKKELAAKARTKRELERELQKLEAKISLLIQNRTSIQEIDRNLKKKLKKAIATKVPPKELFFNDKKKMEGYANLFYLLQTEPKYLAKLAYVAAPEKVEAFMKTMLSVLYGEAFSPREEYLILEMFKMCILTEARNVKSPMEIAQGQSVISKMILTYNKRRQGTTYLKETFTPIIKNILEKDIDLSQTDRKMVVMKLTAEHAAAASSSPAKKGDKKKKEKEKEKEPTGVPPEVEKKADEIVRSRTEELTKICTQIVNVFKSTVDKIPYGLRLLCKQIYTVCSEVFPKFDKDEFWKVIGYFLSYRFINLIITQPEDFEFSGNIPPASRKNLALIAKVLQQAFNLHDPKREENQIMRDWYLNIKPIILEIFQKLIAVPEPEEYLQVNKYIELTSRTRPVILITPQEIVQTHQMLVQHLDQITTGGDDPLKLVLKDLGPVPEYNEEGEQNPIQLTLESKFKTSLEDISPEGQLYEETKEIIIKVFKKIPMQMKPPYTLMSILKQGEEYAKKQNIEPLKKNVKLALENIAKLEKAKMVSAADDYASLLKDIGREVANRAERILSQKREVERLKAAIKKIVTEIEAIKSQIADYERYLQGCRENASKKAREKKTVKFSHKELTKIKIILESKYPEEEQAKIKFFWSMPSLGKFQIEAKSEGRSLHRADLDLEDLLERKDKGEFELEFGDKIIFHVPNLILLLNKSFLS